MSVPVNDGSLQSTVPLSFQIPLCVITPGQQAKRFYKGRLMKFSGTPLYFNEGDQEHEDYFIPIVVAFNGLDHFVGTSVLSMEEQNLFRIRMMVSHLEHASDIYHEIDWGNTSAPMKEAMSQLKFNVDSVQTAITSSFRQMQGVPVIVSPPQTPPARPSISSATPSTAPHEDSARKHGEVRAKVRRKRNIHPADRPHVCACGAAFARSNDLEDHRLSVHEKTVFHCDQCSQPFKYKKTLIRHMREQHQAAEGCKYHCKKDKCNFGSDDKDVVKRHMIKRHGEGYKQKCRHCNKLVSLLGTRKHDKVCKGRVSKESRLMKCSYKDCNREFITAAGKDLHENIHHKGIGGHPCSSCGKILATKASLQRHLQRHTGDSEEEEDTDEDTAASESQGDKD